MEYYSHGDIVGQALLASCAYSGRVAVAYTSDYMRPHPSDASKQLINLYVTVYECESTGKPLSCRAIHCFLSSVVLAETVATYSF